VSSVTSDYLRSLYCGYDEIEVGQDCLVTVRYVSVPGLRIDDNRRSQVSGKNCDWQYVGLPDLHLPLFCYAFVCGPSTPDTSTTPATISTAPSSFGQVIGSRKIAIEASAATSG